MIGANVDEYGVKVYNPLVLILPALVVYFVITMLATFGLTVFELGVEGATVQTVGDCVWLSVMASSTVGFGDVYPITTEGRFIVGGMFFVGMLLIGVVVGTMSKWIESLTDNSVQNKELRQQLEFHKEKDLANARKTHKLLGELNERL